MYCAHSPRRNNTLMGLLLSKRVSSWVKAFTSTTSVLATCTTTSPSRMPAFKAGSATASTRTPPLRLSSFFKASVKSLTVNPSNCAALGGVAFSVSFSLCVLLVPYMKSTFKNTNLSLNRVLAIKGRAFLPVFISILITAPYAIETYIRIQTYIFRFN